MDKKEIRALLEKLMGAFADTEEEKTEAADSAEEVAVVLSVLSAVEGGLSVLSVTVIFSPLTTPP